jgi:hypothetical protein
MKEMYSLTQRPDKQKVYTVQETADLLNASDAEVRRIIGYYKIKHEIVKTQRSRAVMIGYDSFRLIKERYEEKQKRREEAAKNAELRKQKHEEETDGADKHPLVTDKRFLNLTFFPDVIPDCFKELK